MDGRKDGRTVLFYRTLPTEAGCPKSPKRDFYQEKLKENVWKPNKLWKALKFLGLPFKITPVSQISLKDGKKISFDQKTNNNSIKHFYANLTLNLANKLPHAPNKFDVDSILAYYKRFLNTENHKHKFTFSPTLEDKVLKLLKDTNPVKAAGTDNLSGRFLKYRAVVFEVSCSYFSFTNIKTMWSFNETFKISFRL